MQFSPLAVGQFVPSLRVKGTDGGKGKRNARGADFVSRAGRGDSGGRECYGGTQFAHTPTFLKTTVAMMGGQEIVDLKLGFGK